MSDFKSGDVVVLKSGGPKMTVEETYGAWEVICIWFNESGALKREKIVNISIKKVQQ